MTVLPDIFFSNQCFYLNMTHDTQFFYQLRWWKFWHDFSKHCEEKMCPAMINLSKRFFFRVYGRKRGEIIAALIFPLSSDPCILLAKTLRCSHNIYNKVNKLTHSSLFTDLFTKTRSAAAAAGIFLCHTLGAHNNMKVNLSCSRSTLGAINKSFCAP